MPLLRQLKARTLIPYLIGGSIIAYMISIVSIRDLYEVIKGADYRLFLLAWIVTLLSTFLRTLRFLFLSQKFNSLLKTYAVFSLARFLNMALPFRTGDAAILAILKKAGLSKSIAETLPIWFVLRVTDVLALAIWVSIVIGLSPLREQYLPYAIMMSAFCLLILFNIQILPRLFLRASGYVSNVWLSTRLSKAAYGASGADTLSKKTLASILGIGIWGAMIVSTLCLQFAFLTPLKLSEAALVSVLALMASVLPIHAPLGIGTGDLMWAGAMIIVGVPKDLAIAIAVSLRFSVIAIQVGDAAIGSLILTFLKFLENSRSTNSVTEK